MLRRGGSHRMGYWFAGPRWCANGLFPMAPNCALIALLLGSVLFSAIAWLKSRTIHIVIAGIFALCTPIAGLTLIGIMTAHNLNIDNLLLKTTGTIGTIPVGRMSPVTAICLLLGCTAFVLLLSRKKNQCPYRHGNDPDWRGDNHRVLLWRSVAVS